jgi:hypothetical protein
MIYLTETTNQSDNAPLLELASFDDEYGSPISRDRPIVRFIEIHKARFDPRSPVTAPKGLPGFFRHGQPVDLPVLAPWERADRHKVGRFGRSDPLVGEMSFPPMGSRAGMSADSRRSVSVKAGALYRLAAPVVKVAW